MALKRGLARPLACYSCQTWILRSFIASVAGGTAAQTFAPRQRRAFVRTTRQYDSVRQTEIPDAQPVIAPHDESSATPSSASESSVASNPQTSNSQLPWYLQVQQPLPQPESPLSDRQRLPDLPVHPPELLKPILEHVSIELGMDDLSLLDMRALDPPPALGTNLLMIVGTARSEKHLHVSADRLCRWLRTQYKLSPYADGLLGRNELKLKLRRKAKRTRLLSAVGTKEAGQADLDDGIRTGWVCVNVGRVHGGELPQEQASTQDREGIVGFGSIAGGSSIVVQLMTEEKRGEVDLENLWIDALRRSDKRKEKLMLEEEQPAEEHAKADGELTLSSESLPDESRLPSHHRGMHQPSAAGTMPSQLRAYHTSTRRRAAVAATVPTASSLEPPHADLSLIALERNIAVLMNMRRRQALDKLGIDMLHASARIGLGDTRPADVVEVEPPTPGTRFINRFYGWMPAFPGPEHYHYHFELLASARQFGHSRLHSTVFTAHLKQMQVNGLIPALETFKLVIRSILSPLGSELTRYDGVSRFPTDGKLIMILSILEDMEACGYEPLTADILELLHRSCLGPPLRSPAKQTLNDMIPALRTARLSRHVRQNDWQAFWRTWHAYPRHFLPRTSEMYAVLFKAIADGKTRNVEEARNAMKIYVPQMEMEEPPVKLNRRLAHELLRAFTYAKPRLLSTTEEKLPIENGRMRALYEQCRQLLQGLDSEPNLK